MLYLILSILCSVLLGFIFKLYPRFGVDTFQAIVFNYITCVICATIHLGHFPVDSASFHKPWMPYAIGLGLVFITGFNTAALTVRYFGVTISQIMQKMTLMLSVPFAIIMYNESAGWMKIIGVFFALFSIILVNLPNKSKAQEPEKNLGVTNLTLFAIPFVTWFLASIIDITFIRVQNEKMIEPGDIPFLSTIFGTAGLLGLSYAIYGWATGKLVFSYKNVLGGIVLGIPNYASILFILLALGSGWEGSVFFPLNNVGIILVTTIGAVLLFHEKLSAINWAGIAMAVAAIAFISL